MYFNGYEHLISNLSYGLTYQLPGMHRRVWGYPTPIEEKKTGLEAFDKDTTYEGQVSTLTSILMTTRLRRLGF